MTMAHGSVPSGDEPVDRSAIGADVRWAKGVQVGARNIQHNYFTGRMPVDWPHRVGVVPLLADGRQDRPADVDLATATAGAETVVCQVLAGLGGMGKTQVAAGFAHRLWTNRMVDLMVWVTAASRTAVVTTYAQTAADVTGIEDSDPEQGATRFLAWLGSTSRRWLVVLDDLVDPMDLTGLWPPVTGTGRTVVTTRRRDSALLAGRHQVHVGLFTPQEAGRYLRYKLGDQPHQLDQVDALAADLGYLPLALAQAAAYLVDQGLTCADYRRRLRSRKLARLVTDALPDQHRAAVAATWGVSIDLAERLNPLGLARPVLELAALLDPNAIPTALFTTAAVTGYCTSRLARPVDADDTHDAVRLLHRFNLATVDESTSTVHVHSLVQRAVREDTGPDRDQALTAAAADGLLQLWADIERDPAYVQRLRVNTAALHAVTGEHLWTGRGGSHPVLFRAGDSLGEAGLVDAAVGYFERLYVTASRHFGADHPDTLASRHHLARWRMDAGDVAGAATAYEALLPDRVRVLGPDHPDTLASRHNLAHWPGQSGDPAGSVTAMTELLTDRLRVLGPDHPDTLATRHSLAYWRGEAGDAAGAVAAFAAVFADRLRVLGPDHPNTLNSRAGHAYWRGQAGDATGAVTAYEALLDDYLRVLGPDNPDTLSLRHDLAHMRGQAGDPAGAVVSLAAVHTDRLRILGPDHPDTLATRHNLAHWRRRTGVAKNRPPS
jgi:hypothetical protein